jgi:hypothetical protein
MSAILHFAGRRATPECLLKLVILRGAESVAARAAFGVNQMDVQQTAYPSIEVHLAAQNARSEEDAGMDIENPARQSQTIRLNKTSNVDSVTDFHLSHGSLFQIDSAGEPKIIHSPPVSAKNFLSRLVRTLLYIVLRRHLLPACLTRL